VTVELVPGGRSAVTVTSEAPLRAEMVAAALDEAGGYRLAAA
jgi:copper chaperone